MQRPGEAFPLQRLAELYRERDGKLDALVEKFERRVEQGGSDEYPALVALAGIYEADARRQKAIEAYERAIGLRPKDPVAILALGRLHADRGEKKEARQRYSQALELLSPGPRREQVLRTLMALSLDLDDLESAKKYHREIVQRAKGSFFVRAELGRELLVRGEYEKAEHELREVVRAAAGDNRALAPALRDLGKALTRQKKSKEALEVLERALRAAGSQSGLRREVFDLIVEVYRADDRLLELIARLEKERPGDFDRLAMLGGLYEETGQVEKALETYKRALGRRDDITTRLKVVQLLQVQGKLDEAIAQYEALIRDAPHNPDFVFQLAEALIQRGDRAEALRHLQRLEARSGGDEDALAALVDFYERVDEPDRARKLLERLARGNPRDPRHLVELGDRYFQEGDVDRAVRTWQRIRTAVPDRARALHALGEVYLEHDMGDQALEALEKAMDLDPSAVKYKKAYALALERTGSTAPRAVRQKRYEQARRLWEEMLREAGDQPHLQREARQHIVTLWNLDKELDQRIRPLERRLSASPPDLEAGRLLAEAYIRLRRYGDAERTLRKVIEHAPGDAPSYLQLERVLVMQRKLDQAIDVLARLVKIEPKRAREYYQRMAQYSAELYRDDEAIRYAAKAVDLSPEDAEGHRKLGEMYRRRQDTEKAIIEYRRALAKNDRLFSVYFELAELLLNRGDIEEADRLLRRVMRATPDEDLVSRAARLSMQINLGRGTLESLEKELLPIALGNPGRPVYRRLLVEIYGNLAFPLVHTSRSADPERAQAAREKLRQIGERAVKPLLDALQDERDSQQRIAIELLSHIDNKSASAALFSYATGKADPDLRTRAMIAVGALEDPRMLPKLEELISPKGHTVIDETDPVAVAAAWSAARLKSPRARPLLASLLESDAPTIRALGALGLGLLRSHRDAVKLARVVRSPHAGSLARAAAAYALGAIGARDEEDALRELAEATDPQARAAAVLALSRLDSDGAPRAVAQALVSATRSLRSAAAAAALVIASGEYRIGSETLPVVSGRVDLRETLDALVPTGYDDETHAKALLAVADDLRRACVTAVQSSPERARVVADALLARAGAPTFAPLVLDLGEVSDKTRERASTAIDSIAAAVVGPFVALSRHPSAEVRARAVQFLSTRPEENAIEAVLGALEDDDKLVQRAALDTVTHVHDTRAVTAVTGLITGDADWPIRVRATEALGEMAAGSANETVARVLEDVARTDDFAFVRQAAVESLHAVAGNDARKTLREVAEHDPEPRVRQRAAELLETR